MSLFAQVGQQDDEVSPGNCLRDEKGRRVIEIKVEQPDEPFAPCSPSQVAHALQPCPCSPQLIDQASSTGERHCDEVAITSRAITDTGVCRDNFSKQVGGPGQ